MGHGRIGRLAALAAGATVPALAGLWWGAAEAGFSASFGAYLLSVSFPAVPKVAGWQKLGAGAVLLAASGAIGAACGFRLPVLVPAAMLFALWQARTELVPCSLRPVAALSTLVMLMSTSPLPAGVTPIGYSLALGGGALWQAVLVHSLQTRSEAGRLTLLQDLTRPWLNLRRAERFDMVMVGLGGIGALIFPHLPAPHPGWLLTAALRVMKPTREETLRRMAHRGIGTLLGTLAAVILLSFRLPPVIHAGVLGLILFAMLLIGAKRYALYTFCITIVVLNFSVGTPDMGPGLGLARVGLTLGGMGLGLIATLALPKGGADA